MKRILSLLLLAALLFSLSSCAGNPTKKKPKVFISEGVSITLTKAFKEIKEELDEKGQKINDDGYCARFEAGEVTVRVLNNGLFLAKEFETCTLEEYAEMIVSSNKIMQRQPNEKKNGGAEAPAEASKGSEAEETMEPAAPIPETGTGAESETAGETVLLPESQTAPDTAPETEPEYVRIVPQTENGLTYLEHVELDTSAGFERSYLTVVYRTPTAFWIVQFVCPTTVYEEYKPFFLQWAKTASFAAVFPPPETEAVTGTEA